MNTLSSYERSRIIALLALICISFLFGCKAVSTGWPHDPETPEKVMDYIEKEDLVAYVTKDSDTIYVAQGFEEVIATDLEAKIEGDVWLLKEEDFGVKRPLKLLDWRKWNSNVYIEVEWTYLNGHDCQKKKKGQFVDFFDNNGVFQRSYRVPEDSHWCIKNEKKDGEEHVCRTRHQAIRGEFWTGKKGKGSKRIEDRHLSICKK